MNSIPPSFRAEFQYKLFYSYIKMILMSIVLLVLRNRLVKLFKIYVIYFYLRFCLRKPGEV